MPKQMASEIEQVKNWTPRAQEQIIDAARQIKADRWRPFYCPRPGCDGKPHDNWSFPHARADQHPPKGDWLTWLIRGGRGSGKTRSGTEWVHRRTKISPRIALVAATGPDGRAIMVEGESGILEKSPPGKMPKWEPSKRELTWPNGAKAFLYSGEEPDRLRGPQHFDAWVDEPAHIEAIEEVWSNLEFGLRLGRRPRICATTTPLPTKFMKDLIQRDNTTSVVASTYANIDNLAPHFAKTILERYEGTRLGRQEIHGEILADVEGALWSYDMFDNVEAAPELVRIVVAVDPAGRHRKRSDETGIIVVGLGEDGRYYVLADHSGKYSPNGWATKVKYLYETHEADAVVVEINFGGDMVRTIMEDAFGDDTPRIEEVTSRRSKQIRADPVVALYERGKVSHVGMLTSLEDQQVSWVPGKGDSPDRVDALVHGITAIAKVSSPSEIASPTQLRRLRAT